VSLSIIIPTYNEQVSIGTLLAYLLKHTSPRTEIIVADGGSSDATCSIVKELGVKLMNCKQKGRASQMNEAASVASGDILYFLQADTYPPESFEQSIFNAIAADYNSGCFRLAFDLDHWFLKANAWFTRFNVDAIRFGDQSLFVQKGIFLRAGRFNEQLVLLEDQEVVTRLKKKGRFIVLDEVVITSARKYQEVGVYKLQAGYFLLYTLYRAGVEQDKLINIYKWLLHK